MSKEHGAKGRSNPKILTVPTNGVNVEVLMIGGVSTEVYKPKTYDYTVIYIHGGGFISGSVKSYRKYVTWFCKTNRCKAISIDYRLAPLHSYPAGLNDCFEVYRDYIKMGNDPKKTVFMGDSAGGNLILALALKAKDPYISVINGSFIGFPPTYITVGELEMLLDDSLKLNEKLVEQGVKLIVKNISRNVSCFSNHVDITRSKKMFKRN